MDQGLRDILAGRAAGPAFREPSAAERARKAVRPASARPLSRRDARRAAKLRRPVQDRKARRDRRSRPRRRPRIRPLLIFVTVVALLCGAGVWLASRGLLPGAPLGFGDGGKGGGNGGVAPVPAQSPAFTTADPFAGTPAERFADGAAGVTVPPAAIVGGFSTSQVAAAYSVTRQLLIASALDPRALAGGSPDAFAGLLAGDDRTQFLRGLNRTDKDRNGFSRSTRTWLITFAPGSMSLVGPVIKVRGRMSATAVTQAGQKVLRISVDYLFVYPVQRPGEPLTRTRVVARERGYVDFGYWTGGGGRFAPNWQVPHGAAGARCEFGDGFIHPDFPGGSPASVRPSGMPLNPYDQSQRPMRGCQAVTGT